MIVGGRLVNGRVALTLGSRIGENRPMIVPKPFLVDVFALHRIPGDIICVLPDLGFSYKDVPAKFIERRVEGSNALTPKNMLSMAQTLVDPVFRCIANLVYRRW
jgi:hypothetical protein